MGCANCKCLKDKVLGSEGNRTGFFSCATTGDSPEFSGRGYQLCSNGLPTVDNFLVFPSQLQMENASPRRCEELERCKCHGDVDSLFEMLYKKLEIQAQEEKERKERIRRLLLLEREKEKLYSTIRRDLGVEDIYFAGNSDVNFPSPNREVPFHVENFPGESQRRNEWIGSGKDKEKL